jgi:mRNA-degrading endonuclease RelE of RelBE toxin-antitoxin system
MRCGNGLMVKILEEAEHDLNRFENGVANKILDEIEGQLEDGVDSEAVKVIQRPTYDAVFHRLKLAENGLDHRIYFDYKDSELYVFAVRHRDKAYTEEDLKESVKRLQNI